MLTSGQSIYTGFGLEGVNNMEGTTSREELLQTFFNWANDRPTVTISQTMSVDTSNIVTFAATVTSPVTNTSGVTYRWDFGDGTAIAGPFASSQSLHTYEVCGTYTVRVEATDSYGHRSIGTLHVNVDEGCEGWRLYLPQVYTTE
jgi:PKD repeat protein